MLRKISTKKIQDKAQNSRVKAEIYGVKANNYLDTHLFRRLNNIFGVWRFVLSWLFLVLFLIVGVSLQTRALNNNYLVNVPVAGGRYTEGVVGRFSSANPLFAASGPDAAISTLIFNGLFKYDASNRLVGDLAEKYTSDEKGQVYDVFLRGNVLWHDGQRFSADDVIFTYQTIQNPDVRSIHNVSWRNIKVEKISDTQVKFTLPAPLSSFPHSMTNGIVPKHILAQIPSSQIRTNDFNTLRPIGTGPFKWDVIINEGPSRDSLKQQIRMNANSDYHFGKPNLNGFNLVAYSSLELMQQNFLDDQIDAMWGQTGSFNDEVIYKSAREVPYNTNGGVYLFFNNSIFTEPKIRQALTYATQPSSILSSLGYPVQRIDGPFLKEMFTYNADLAQLKFNEAEANRLLDESGFVRTEGQKYRSKDGIELKIRITLEDKTDYKHIAEAFAKQWEPYGVKVEIDSRASIDFEQTTLITHAYEALIYGISLGTDPDVYVYWHSSQGSPQSITRLNLSEYNNKTADSALEAGRVRTDVNLRNAKYRPFLEAWRTDAPAIALYRPQYSYIQNTFVYSQTPLTLNSSSGRYYDVHNWMKETVRIKSPN